jgi:hypothetical protein
MTTASSDLFKIPSSNNFPGVARDETKRLEVFVLAHLVADERKGLSED